MNNALWDGRVQGRKKTENHTMALGSYNCAAQVITDEYATDLLVWGSWACRGDLPKEKNGDEICNWLWAGG